MTEALNTILEFECFYTDANGDGLSGLAVTADIYNSASKLLSDQSVTDRGGGLYRVAVANTYTASETNIYTIFKTTSTAVPVRQQVAYIPVRQWVGDIANIKSIVDASQTTINTIIAHLQVISRKLSPMQI
jgi:hypothetical protein